MKAFDNTEIIQPKRGYRFSKDPFLLAGFIKPDNSKRVIDIGSGNGIIPLLLQKLMPSASFFGLDIRLEPLGIARTNCPNATFINGNLAEGTSLFKPDSFDMAISNPPYRKLDSGRINPCPEKAVARHELKMTLEELIACAAHLLKDGGRFYLCHIPEREEELLSLLEKNRFATEYVRPVYGRRGKKTFIILVSARKGGKKEASFLPPLVVFETGNEYTLEMKEIYERLKIDRN